MGFIHQAVTDIAGHLAARQARGRKPHPDLDALKGLNPHHRRGDAGIQPAIPRQATAQAHRAAEDVAFDDAARGVLGELLLGPDNLLDVLDSIGQGVDLDEHASLLLIETFGKIRDEPRHELSALIG